MQSGLERNYPALCTCAMQQVVFVLRREAPAFIILSGVYMLFLNNKRLFPNDINMYILLR